MNIAEVVQKIQYMIVPAVMVSSSALLLLGFHNKFSNLANRFRVLNQEKRTLEHKEHKEAREISRLDSLTQQTRQLMKRASYVKDAILATYIAIICFVGTSILIYLNLYAPFQLNFLISITILVGFLALMVSGICMYLETILFYKIIVIESRQ